MVSQHSLGLGEQIILLQYTNYCFNLQIRCCQGVFANGEHLYSSGSCDWIYGDYGYELTCEYDYRLSLAAVALEGTQTVMEETATTEFSAATLSA